MFHGLVLGVLVLFENSIVCQCTFVFCLWFVWLCIVVCLLMFCVVWGVGGCVPVVVS